MLGKSLASALLTFEATTICSFSSSDRLVQSFPSVKFHQHDDAKSVGTSGFSNLPKKWKLQALSQTDSAPLLQDDEEKKMWEASRQALSTLKLGEEEAEKILSKAFGWAHSPYWGEEREKQVPKVENIKDKLDYLRTLGLESDEIFKLLKKFPEVLGCSLDDELKMNVEILEKQWGIDGKALRNLLIRNPKVLGYNVDCKGDCMAKCTRCWVRF